MRLLVHVDPLLLPATYEAGPKSLPCELRDSVQNLKGFMTQLFGVPFLRQDIYLNGIRLDDDHITLDLLGVEEDTEISVRKRPREGSLYQLSSEPIGREGSWTFGSARGLGEASRYLPVSGTGGAKATLQVQLGRWTLHSITQGASFGIVAPNSTVHSANDGRAEQYSFDKVLKGLRAGSREAESQLFQVDSRYRSAAICGGKAVLVDWCTPSLALSPTALEQEALDAANGSKQRTPSGAGVGAPNVKTGGAKAKAKCSFLMGGGTAAAVVHQLVTAMTASGLQKEWKEKMNSPSHRKAGPPRINRKPEQKVLSEEERKEKMGEIDALEVQLQQARGVAAAASRAAAAAASHVASYAQQSQSAQDAESGSEDHEEENDQAKANKEVGPDDLSRQAEERVRARKRKEAKDRKERERRDAEEKKTKQAEAEAKTKDLERITRERLQEKSRAERAREQQLKEERERESQLKEQRSQAAREELQQLTSKRVAEREQAERQRAEELARHEAEERRLHEEESEAKAMLLREKTRLRVQEHSRDQREHLMAEEEARLRRLEEVAKASEERSQEAQQSQQRARARAADFRQRARLEAEEHARLDEEQLARERERSDAALEERHRKRHYRPGSEPSESHAAPANVRPESPAQPAAAAAQPRRPAAQQAQQQQPQQQQPQQHQQQQQQRHQPPAQQVQAHHMPPRPPVERAAGAVGAPEQNTVATKRVQPSRAPAAAAVQRAVGKGAAAGAAGSKVSGQKEARGRRGSEAEVVQGGHGADEESRNWSIAVDDGETVRCNVGFFGMGGDPLDSDGEDEAPQFPDDFGDEGDGYSRPGSGYSALANRRATSSQAGNRVQRAPSAPAAPPFAPPPGPMTRAAVRAYSQPPLNRPQQDVPRGGLSGGGDYSRGSSPGGGADYGGRCFEAEVTSMGAARAALGLPRSPSGSCHSEPVGHAGGHSPALQKPTPWKQRAIQVNSTDYYLDAMKAARGGGQKGGQKPAGNKPAVRTTPNKEGYADQARQHASDVEVRQREEEGARQERGYAVLQRVQQRAAQASPLRGMSCD
ncbi:unnamed protein product [Polarella glacialis]|uniref:Ubiquitin-like domain-containing protein n=1 Tax=Polarella glacialis TaxID=89957 RepID=A0A813EAG1_POLGL|nr:unnamed protein product [Polarella glacialis]